MGRPECVPSHLAAMMQERGCTVGELSAETEIPTATLRGYLNGSRQTISTRNMLLIAQFFDISMSDLMDRLSESGIANKDEGQNSSI